MAALNPQVLKQLHDIHMPPPEPWWHLPWGIWAVLGLGVLALLILVWAWKPMRRAYRNKQQHRQLEQAIEQEIRHIEQHWQQRHTVVETVAEVSKLLRRVAMTRFPEAHIEGLTGEAWLTWLDARLSEPLAQGFASESMRQVLAQAYQPSSVGVTQAQVDDLLQLTRRWVKEVVSADV